MDPMAVRLSGTYDSSESLNVQMVAQARLMKMSLDQQTRAVQEMLSTMQQAAPNPPNLGNNIDVIA